MTKQSLSDGGVEQTEYQTIPTLVVCGSTGSGKRIFLESLVHAHIQNEESDKKGNDGIPVFLLDTPDTPDACADFCAAHAKCFEDGDVILWLVRFDRTSLEADRALLHAIHAKVPKTPILLIGFGIESGVAFFSPATFSPDAPKTPHEKKVHEWLLFLRTFFADIPFADILLCSVGSSAKDVSRHYNLPAISLRIESLIPESMRLAWLTSEVATQDRSEKADKMIVAATTVAGTIGLVPFPIADMPFIVATQVALIVGLCSLYGKAFTKDTAKSLVLAALSALAGPVAFQNIVKVVPGLGSLVGGSVAAGCTYAVGKVTKMLLEKNMPFDVQSFSLAVKRIYHEYVHTKKGKKE